MGLADYGITVGILHTGKHYADDLMSDGVLYHYPHTLRHPSYDHNEIEATKMAGILELPIFVISHNPANQSLRDVHLGWIVDWDDNLELFLILFQSEMPVYQPLSLGDEVEFELFDTRPIKRGLHKVRDHQAEFQFQVFQRYGTKCAVCDVDVKELLEAAHIVPKSDRGTDDPRNGLVFCVLHHKAFDTGLFGIDPDTMQMYYPIAKIAKDSLGIKSNDLTHLDRLPHREALRWNWKRFQ